MKKIIILSYGASRQGGIEEVTRQVYSILRREKNVSVKMIVWPISKPSIPLAIMKLTIFLFKGYRPIVMHPYIFERVSFLKKAFSGWVVWAYGIDVWGRFGLEKAPSLAKADLVVTISKYTKERILENHNDVNVRVVPLTVSTDIERTVNGSVVRNKNEIITVGRLSSQEKYKGHDIVLKALSVLKKRGIFVKYNIVGSGNDIERLASLSEELKVSDQVEFHGFVPDGKISEIYSRSSVFVMPSFVEKREFDMWSGEGFGLVYLEAGLHRLPVIACDEGGQTDCVIHGKTGFLVRPDEHEVAEKIQMFIDNPCLAKQMGDEGYRFVVQRFGSEKFKKEVLSLVDFCFTKIKHLSIS